MYKAFVFLLFFFAYTATHNFEPEDFVLCRYPRGTFPQTLKLTLTRPWIYRAVAALEQPVDPHYAARVERVLRVLGFVRSLLLVLLAVRKFVAALAGVAVSPFDTGLRRLLEQRVSRVRRVIIYPVVFAKSTR